MGVHQINHVTKGTPSKNALKLLSHFWRRPATDSNIRAAKDPGSRQRNYNFKTPKLHLLTLTMQNLPNSPTSIDSSSESQSNSLQSRDDTYAPPAVNASEGTNRDKNKRDLKEDAKKRK